MGIRTMITKSGKRYRVEAMVNVRRYSQTFKRKKDAEVYLAGILAMRVKQSCTNQYEETIHCNPRNSEFRHDWQSLSYMLNLSVKDFQLAYVTNLNILNPKKKGT